MDDLTLDGAPKKRRNAPCLCLVQIGHPTPDWRAALEETFPTTESPGEADYIVVIGGDGALLHSIERHWQVARPFFGINAGTRGVLMNALEGLGELQALFDDVHVEELWLIEADVSTDEGVQRVLGFNDIWVERETGQTLKMMVSLDGVRQPALIVGDGMLFSTPQGSTGYNRALRGKVILPGVRVLQMTPMSCVVNKVPLGSLLLPDETKVRVDFQELGKRPARLFHDGVLFSSGVVQQFTIRKSERTVKLGFTHRQAFRGRALAWQFQL